MLSAYTWAEMLNSLAKSNTDSGGSSLRGFVSLDMDTASVAVLS